MGNLKELYKFIFSEHLTKMLGFLQVTIGVLAAADGVLPESWIKYMILFTGLMTAWRGFFNSSQITKDPPPSE
jgi:hypothetical protein